MGILIQVVSDCLHDLFLLFSYFFGYFFTTNLAKIYIVPLFVIGISISAVFLGIKVIRSIINK